MATVHVIDDDQGIRLLVRDVLRDAGFEVATSATVHEAIAAIEDSEPDLLVLDLSLPDSDLLQRVVDTAADSCVLVLSGSVKLEERAADLGADASLAKPFDLDDLLRVVTRLVEDRHLHRGTGPAA
ncbi:MAG: response regulator [Dehalococcoidia bacterium]|nr:response regulator [Dehalococcoidia bacterium]